jgi:hypothetical protein
MRTRRIVAALVATLCALATFLIASISAQDHSTSRELKLVYHDQPPVLPLPDTLNPEQFAQNDPAFAAYTLAARVRRTLYQIPCYCPCDKLKGHKSLLDCFASNHGASCHICQQETIFCFLHRRESASQIRKRIADGEAWTIDLSKSAQLLDAVKGATDK